MSEVMEQVKEQIFNILPPWHLDTVKRRWIDQILSIPELKEGLELYLKAKNNANRRFHLVDARAKAHIKRLERKVCKLEEQIKQMFFKAPNQDLPENPYHINFEILYDLETPDGHMGSEYMNEGGHNAVEDYKEFMLTPKDGYVWMKVLVK